MKTLVGLFGYKSSQLSFLSLQIYKYFLISSKAESFCYMINPLLDKLLRSRWLDIGLDLFWRFYARRRNSYRSHWCWCSWHSRHKGGCLSCFYRNLREDLKIQVPLSIRPRSFMISILGESRAPSNITSLKSQVEQRCLGESSVRKSLVANAWHPYQPQKIKWKRKMEMFGQRWCSLTDKMNGHSIGN